MTILGMYSHHANEIPADIPASNAGFHRTVLDVERRKPQLLLRFSVNSWISSDVLKIGNGGEGGIRTPDRLTPMSDFESGAFNRALPPLRFIDHSNL